MSVLIKGATLQQVMRVIMHSTEWLSDDVEIVEVPKHGRLIDADKMITRFENINDFLMGDCKFGELASSDKARVDELANCIAEIVNAPTVIDTEGDKHDV